jgi:hypothetical protein
VYESDRLWQRVPIRRMVGAGEGLELGPLPGGEGRWEDDDLIFTAGAPLVCGDDFDAPSCWSQFTLAPRVGGAGTRTGRVAV